MVHILERAPPPRGERVYYGKNQFQFAELRFPSGQGPFPLLFVIHGGFWKAEYDLEHIGHLCTKFTSYGVVTCNIEYRRVGNKGGGWPGTFLDVANAIDYFHEIFAHDLRVDANRAAVIGHSAGGHLSLWLGARHKIPNGSAVQTGPSQKWQLNSICLAGVSDLRTGWEQNLGSGAVAKLLGGSPKEYPERYMEGSPYALLPTGLKQVLIHGREDDIVPISQSERYFQRARETEDNPTLISLDEIGHFELIDPQSKAWREAAKPTLEILGIAANF